MKNEKKEKNSQNRDCISNSYRFRKIGFEEVSEMGRENRFLTFFIHSYIQFRFSVSAVYESKNDYNFFAIAAASVASFNHKKIYIFIFKEKKEIYFY
jgi:hypothetical protein